MQSYPEIMTVDSLLSPEECQEAIDRIERLLDHGLAHETNNSLDRKDDCIHITIANAEGLKISETLMGRMRDAVLPEYLSRFPILAQKNLGILECKAQKTEAGGGFHDWHYEAMSGTVANRWLVYTVYLNDTFEAGETEFLYQNMRVNPVAGRCCLFPAGFMHTHRGNPPIGGTKYILTGWVLDLDPFASLRT